MEAGSSAVMRLPAFHMCKPTENGLKKALIHEYI